jgi:hypothetical protein
VCRALQIVCVSAGESSLRSLKKAVTAAEWELTAGATREEDALAQLDGRNAHVLVTWGAFGDLVKRARERHPGLRIIAVGRTEIPDADVNVRSIKDVRDAILGTPPPGGPVRS